MTTVVVDMLRELQEHPDVTVTREVLCEGISEDQLQRVEEELGCSLVKDVRAFFQAHNGLAIEWHWNKHPHAAAEHPKKDEGGDEGGDEEDELPNLMDLMEDYGPYQEGQFIVGPLEDFLTAAYDDIDSLDPSGLAEAFFEHLQEGSYPMETPIQVAQQQTFESEQEFRSRLRYFDFWSRDTGVVLLYQQKTPDPLVMYRDTHDGAFNLKTPTPLSHYLHYVIAHYGLRFRRDLLFDNESIVTQTEKWPTSLEQVLECCRKA